MIITRAPFRVSFCGGGSDLSSFYEKYGGCVLSTTIRKYMYLTIHNYFYKDQIRLKYSKTETIMMRLSINILSNAYVILEYQELKSVQWQIFHQEQDLEALLHLR